MDAFRAASDAGPSSQASSSHASPLPLSQRTSSRNFHSSNGSPPSTPPPRSRRRDEPRRSKQPLRAYGGQEEPVNRDGDGAGHSHGLSWSSTTRDSVVDNLLFSLDNLTRSDMPQPATRYNDEERQMYLSSLASHYTLNRAQQRTRTFTQSSSQTASPASTTRHQHSSSRTVPMHVRNTSSTPKHAHSGSGISRASGEQGSDMGSAERYDPPQLEASRRGWGRRSMSMDQIYADSTSLSSSSVLDRGRPVPSVHSTYESRYEADAAPEPYIAAGPRKMQNPDLTGPVYIGPAQQPKPKQSALRKVTTQSDLRSSAVQLPASASLLDVRSQAADFVRTSSMLAPSNALQEPKSPAPSPAASSRRKDHSPSREKQGFFKRVFGGGNSSSGGGGGGGSSSRAVSGSAEQPNSTTKPPADAAHPAVRSVSQTSTKADAKQSSAGAAGPSLNKKPSSFFRRRKRSTSEALPPAPLPINITGLNHDSKPADPRASISSLRKVMDPFLVDAQAGLPAAKQGDTSRPTTADSKAEDSDDLDMFHSGYTPPADASLRTPRFLSKDSTARPVSSAAKSSPTAKMKLKKRRPETADTADLADMTFLHDASRQNSTVQIPSVQSSERLPVSPVSETIQEDREYGYLGSRPSTGEQILAAASATALYSPTDPGDDAQQLRSLSPPPQSIAATLSDDGRPTSNNSSMLILQTMSMDDMIGSPKRLQSVTSLSAASMSPDSTRPPQPSRLAPLALPSVQVEGNDVPRQSSDVSGAGTAAFVSGSRDSSSNTEYAERARKIFDGNEEDIAKGDAAAWMGERNHVSAQTLNAYMQLFDFCGLNILAALRLLCAKLVLRGETQQFDRIITALSARWCACNPNHGFKAQDVVHTICYSLILLNTDLHLADIGEKMSRSAYVKNTLPTIRRVVADAAPAAFDDASSKPGSAHQLRPALPWMDSNPVTPTSPTAASLDMPSEESPFEATRRLGINTSANTSSKRLSLRPGMLRNDSDGTSTPDSAAAGGASNALVGYPWSGAVRGWEIEIEAVLKSFFNSIRTEPLPLRGAIAADGFGDRNLSVTNLRRSNSIISKAPSDISFRSKPDFRMRWQGRSNRSRPKLYPSSTVASSRTSLDEGSSFWSPAQSKYSMSKTLTSASVGSLGYHYTPATDAFKHSIGFANALSQAIIREESAAGTGDNDSISMPGGLLEDEALALEGAPWAKEGLVKHKHHLETPDRKAKERSWVDCFAVISKGKLTLFAFNTSHKTQTVGRRTHFHKPGRAASMTAAKVGGGDWMENAEQLDVFVLRQTIASTLPPPGYSKSRPHVWALSLPSGAVHLFQVGTPEIAEEFMSTANYWSARLSKEPLAGGVSNIEYGWSEQVINTAILEQQRPESRISTPPSSMQTRNMGHMHSISIERARRPSLQSSLRTSIDTGFGTIKAKLPGDKVHVMEYHPPTQSMMASQLMEVDQLKQLTAYVASSEEELEKHNELKHAIELAYTPRHPNHTKTMNNWQRKSDYLLREIVKFRTYMDSLTAARAAKESFYTKKAELDAGYPRGSYNSSSNNTNNNNNADGYNGSSHKNTLTPVAKDDGSDGSYMAGLGMNSISPRDTHTSG